MALRNDLPTGIGGRGRSPKSLSFSGKNREGTCLSLARSGRSSSPFHVADSSRLAAAGALCADGLGAGLAETAGGWIASGSPLRLFGSAPGPCSDVWVRRAAGMDAAFAAFGAEEVGVTDVRSGCVSLSLRAMAATRVSRAAFSTVAGVNARSRRSPASSRVDRSIPVPPRAGDRSAAHKVRPAPLPLRRGLARRDCIAA